MRQQSQAKNVPAVSLKETGSFKLDSGFSLIEMQAYIILSLFLEESYTAVIAGVILKKMTPQ
jgi:hypothetical protein